MTGSIENGEITWNASSVTVSKYLIYGLIDPRDKKLRYIGRSVTGLKRARTLHSAKCKSWIISLLRKGLIPILVIFQEFDNNENINNILNKSEVSWIAVARLNGHNLLNMTDGGSGFIGFKRSAEQIKMVADFHRGRKRPLETGRRISLAKKGKPSKMIWTEELKRKISLLHKGKPKPKTKEHREKISRTLKGRPSKMKGKKMSEEGRHNLKEAWKKRKKNRVEVCCYACCAKIELIESDKRLILNKRHFCNLSCFKQKGNYESHNQS